MEIMKTFKNSDYIKIFMKNKLKIICFFLSELLYHTYFNFSNLIFFRIYKKKKIHIRFKEKFSIFSKKKSKENLFGFMVQVLVRY